MRWWLIIGLLMPKAFGLDGKSLYKTKQCYTCHGKEGKAPYLPLYPTLAGKDFKCLKEQFIAILMGKRDETALQMKQLVRGITDAERDAILQYLASLPPKKDAEEPETAVCKPAP